jgi:phosphate transport system substrate-binding protein
MNKAALIGIIAAVAVGIIIGVLGTTGAFNRGQSANPSVTNTANTAATPQPVQETLKLSGTVVIDGSSTVYPITEAIAEEFSKVYKDVNVTVAISGTGGGFKRFVINETDINDASRPITDKEKEAASANNVRWLGIPVALEGLTIVVNKSNNLLPNDCISIEQLREIWKPDSSIKYWSDINPSYPRQEIILYGAGPDSGTFDYFTEHVVGKARAIRTDYIPSEDDNVLVQGVANDRYALGFIPLAYSEHALDKIKILKLSNTNGGECVYPNNDTVTQGKYPLSRPLFIYVNYDRLQSKPELKRFVEFYLENAKSAIKKVGYVTLPDKYYEEALKVIKEGRYSANDDTTLVNLYKNIK